MDLAISRHRITVAFLVILGWAAVAHAEDAPSAPAGTRSLAEIPFQRPSCGVSYARHEARRSSRCRDEWIGGPTWATLNGRSPHARSSGLGFTGGALRAED